MSEQPRDLMAALKASLEDTPAGEAARKTSTVNRVRTPADDVVDAWWAKWTNGPPWHWPAAAVLADLAKQPEGVQRGVLRKARGQ